MEMKPLTEFGKVARSKNSGPFEVTFDIIFDSDAPYRHVKDSGAIHLHAVAAAFGVSKDVILVCTAFDAARAFKITLKRAVSSGDLADRDVYGCQQHLPLVTLMIPA